MPDGSGFDLIAAIGAAEAHAAERTAMLICSGSLPPPLSEPLPAHDAFFAKPINMQALLATPKALGIDFAPGTHRDQATASVETALR